jgi:predicted MFS family arabinose efflux permease
MSALGFGALLGALTLAVLSSKGPRPRLLISGALGLSIFSILIGFQSQYVYAALILALMGWSMIVFAASSNSLIQLTVEDRLRGRVMSVYSLVFGGLTPLGSLYSGTLSHWLGAKATFIISGMLSLFFLLGILYWRRRHGGISYANRSSI